MSASSFNTKPTDASSSSKGNLVAVVKDGVHSLGKHVRDAFSPSKAAPVRDEPEVRLPAYKRYATAGIPGVPQVSIDYSYSLNPETSYRITDTGDYERVRSSQGHGNLVVGPDRHTITFRERTSLIETHLSELDRLIDDAPGGGYPPHSTELFKSLQLVKAISVLSDVRVPTHASREYLEKIQGLIAIHERMVAMERTLVAVEGCSGSGEPSALTIPQE